MTLVKLSFRSKRPTEKVVLSRHIVTKMTGNVNFPNPVPSLTAVATAAEALETAVEAAVHGNNIQKFEVRERNDELTKLISSLMSYVQAESAGNANKILSSGMDVRNYNGHHGLLAAPRNLNADFGDFEGEIKLSWTPRIGSKSYLVEFTSDPIPMPGTTNGTGNGTVSTAENISWKAAGTCTKSRFVVKNLTSGTRYFFRVAAINAAGQSPYSDPAMRMAP